MKAFLLAAGFGTRLRPITDKIPKCLVPIHGQPLLGWWLDLLRKHQISDVLINTHYLSDQVKEFIEEYKGENGEIRIINCYESELLGSGGTVRNNHMFVQDEDDFLVCYADNLTDINISELIKFHKSCEDSVLTMGLFHTNLPKQCGIVSINHRGKITSFVEKPMHPEGNLANAGIYVVNKKIFNYLPQKKELDIGKDVLPKVVSDGFAYGWMINDYIIDIGTIENYNKAKKEWKHDYHQDSVED